MVSLTSVAAGAKLCCGANSRHIGHSERSNAFLDNHQHRPDRLERQRRKYEPNSGKRYWSNRQQLDDSIKSELDYDQRHKFSRCKSKQHEPNRRYGNFGQHEFRRQQLG